MELLALLAIAGKLQSGLLVALGLGLVIFFHELGHFAVAKWCNVYVERFSIGFGPVLLGWKWGETEYALSAIPFGGYVKMLGQDDADPSQLTSEELAKDPRSYSNKPVPQRMAIISAGVIMNIITGAIFFATAFFLGLQVAPPIIGSVDSGSPAWRAGIIRGDVIESIDGHEVNGFAEFGLRVALSTGPIQLVGKHQDGTPFDLTIHPDTSGTRPTIGVHQTMSLRLINDESGRFPPTIPGSLAAAAVPPFAPGDTLLKLNETELKSFTQLQDSLSETAGQEITFTVKRKKSDEIVQIKVGPNFFHTLGFSPDTGPVMAIRDASPADRAGMKVGDKIAKVDGKDVGTEIDPFRLPDVFYSLAGEEVDVVVSRQIPAGGQVTETLKITPEKRAAWWEQPNVDGEPLSIPAIGLAFQVVPRVVAVNTDGPAASAGIQPGALIQSLTLTRPQGAPADMIDKDSIVIPLNDEKKANNWAFAFWMIQQAPNRDIKLQYILDGKQETANLRSQRDESWPLPNRGIHPEELLVNQQASSWPEAFRMAYNHTRNSALNIYQTLRSLVMMKLSPKELHGPLSIPVVAYKIAERGPAYLLSFLGFLSVNLAVLNFLPIPVLDGGHMVFLLWEGITRRRPSERFVLGATAAGLALIGTLMVFVLFLDVFVHQFWKIGTH